MIDQKIIGVDIDGVLTDESHPNDNIWHDRLCQYLGKKIERARDVYNFMEAYNLSSDVIDGFLEEHLENIYSQVNPAPGAKETLLQLARKDFKIYLITARNSRYHSLTEGWLKKHQITYTTLIHEDSKAPLAVEKNIQLFVEDHAETARELLANNIQVILVNKYHNRYLKAQNNLVRVNNWEEIRDYIFKYFQL